MESRISEMKANYRELIDTTIAIDYLRDVELAVNYLESRVNSGYPLYCSVITKIEVYAGMRPNEKDEILDFFSIVLSIDVNDIIAEKSGEYLRRYQKNHGINVPDAIIAASAHLLNCELITLNVKHFPMKDIEVVVPY